MANAKNFVVFRADRQDAELLVKYLATYDPYALKEGSLLEPGSYFALGEQWEPQTNELTELPERVAILKTKGCEPTLFAAYDLPEAADYEFNRELVREQNDLLGYTLSLKALDEAVSLSPTSWVRPDEPESFVE